MQPVTPTNDKDSAVRVSNLELFFDLVFVFTITQVSDLILHAQNPKSVTPSRNWLIWVGAVAVLVLVPFFGKVGGFAIQPAHFVERHGLVLIIALGESVISIGVGAAGEPVTLSLVTAAVLTVALTAALWWSYFSQDEQWAEHALSSVSGGERALMALYAFGYAHLIMIAGVVVAAAGVKQLIEQLHESTHLTTSVLLATGIALYLLGDVVFRRSVRIPSSRLRLSMVLVSLATIPLGVWAGGLAQVGALLLIFVIILGWERAAVRRS